MAGGWQQHAQEEAAAAASRSCEASQSARVALLTVRLTTPSQREEWGEDDITVAATHGGWEQQPRGGQESSLGSKFKKG